MSQQYLSMRRAATEAHVSPHTLERWIQRGALTPIKEGNRYKIRRSDLDALAGPTDATIIRLLQDQVKLLTREKSELAQRVRRLEQAIFHTTFDETEESPVTPTLALPIPMPRSKREIARFLARHGINEESAMRWFRRSPPLPMDPAEALHYADAHCHTVGHRGRDMQVLPCDDPACVCALIMTGHVAQR